MSVFSRLVDRVRTVWGFKVENAAKIPGIRESFGVFDMFGMGTIGQNLKIDNDLMVRYADYEDMDDYPIIAAAYNVLSDDCTVQDYIENKTVCIEAKSRVAKVLLDKMLHERVKIDDNIWEIARTLMKYGNDYEYVDMGEKGVKGLVYLPPPIMRRVERSGDVAFYADLSGTATAENADMIFDRLKTARETFEKEGKKELSWFPQKQFIWEGWQIIHWRNRIKNRGSLYGYAYGEPARWIWKRLILVEDSALIFRLTRAPSRFVYYIDVGNQSPNEALAYVEKVKQRVKRSKFVNARTGKIDLKFNPMPVAFDTVIPLLDGRNIAIKQLAKEYEEGKKNYVYAIDRENGNSMSHGEILWCGKNKDCGKTYKITYDDGSFNIVAEGHPFMLCDGQYVKAKDLKLGNSLMPFYRAVTDRGYETVFDPKKNVFEETHKAVARETQKDKWEHTVFRTIHHSDFDRRNNAPENLKLMSWWEHKDLHRGLLKTTIHREDVLKKNSERLKSLWKDAEYRSKRISEISNEMKSRWNNPEYRAEMEIVARKGLDDFRKTEEFKEVVRKSNKTHNQKRFLIAYNKTEKHEADNEIRRASSLKWMQENKWRFSGENNHKFVRFDAKIWSIIDGIISENSGIGKQKICNLFNSSPENVLYISDLNDRRVTLNKPTLKSKMEQRELVPMNHKIISVEIVSDCDMYCMNVKGKHNFAMLAVSGEYGSPNKDSGVFVKNTEQDDIYLPVREGKDKTRVETLAGPDFQAMDDIEYFQGKLFSALSIPKAYLGYEEVLSCFVPETKISTLDGRERTIIDIVENYKKEKIWVYSNDNGVVVPGKVVGGKKTGTAKFIARVTLDNGIVEECTPEHRWQMRDGSYVMAKELVTGDSLMPRKNIVMNHKVVSVDIVEKTIDVYDIEVENYHNFALSSGVFVHNSRFMLSSEDVRYARNVMRNQQILKIGLRHLCDVELAANNIVPSTAGYKVTLPAPTKVMETAYIELMQLRMALAGDMKELFSNQWIMEHVLKLSQSQIGEIVGQRQKETLDQADIDNEVSEKEMEVTARSAKKFGVSADMSGIDRLSAARKGKSSQPPAVSVREGMMYFTDEEFTKGNKFKEKEMDARLDALLTNDRNLTKKIDNLRGLLGEIVMSNRASRMSSVAQM